MPTPDPAFVRGLKWIDPALRVVWDHRLERWVIVRLVRQVVDTGVRWQGVRFSEMRDVPHWVLAVQNEDGSFRPLDGRTLARLREIDVWRYQRVKDYCDALYRKAEIARTTQDRYFDGERQYRLREDRALWKEAVENARSGLLDDRPRPFEPKVIVDYGVR